MIVYLLIIQAVTFVILLIVLRQLFYKQLNVALLRLKSQQEENLARERELKLQAEVAKAQQEEMLKKAQEEAAEIINVVKATAEMTMADVERDAQERAAKIVEQSQAEFNRKAMHLMANQNQQAIDLAVKIVKLSFSLKGQEALQNYLLEELINETWNLNNEMFAAFSKAPVKVVAARPVSDRHRADLVRVLSDKMGSPVALEIKEDPDIIAGLVINIGSLSLDGSLRHKLAKAAEHLKK